MSALSPRAWLHRAADAFPDAVAIDAGDELLTYTDMAATVDGLDVAAGAGDVVALPARPTTTSVVVDLWSVWRSGAAALPLDSRIPPGFDHWAADFGATVLLRGGRAHRTARPEHPAAHTLVATSGSSGRRRAARITEGNVAAAVEASRQRLGEHGETRWLLALPVTHVGGLSVLWRMAGVGGTVVLHSRFDAAAAANDLRSGRATAASFVPTMLARMLDAHEGPYPGPMVLLGGARIPESLVARARAAGIDCLPTYGLTEATSQVATALPGSTRTRTVGPPLPGVSVSIRDGEGDAEPGVVGEIVVAGPTVFAGYAGAEPQAGPLRTGDLGWLDAGDLVVAGRRDLLIISGGENVQPAIVEAVLDDHPAVAQAAVFGLPDADLGMTVAAAVVRSGAVSERDLADHLRSRLAPFEVPRIWRFYDELPLLGNGKVDIQSIIEEELG